MRALALVPAAVVGLLGAASASADPGTDPSTAAPYSPPFVDHTEWVHWGRLSSLRVYPTPAGRAAARQPATDAEADEAWTEVLARSPDADTAGMRDQFVCHWQLAELVQPGKSSWNLEPWRPVVDNTEMVASGCNPGGAEGGAPPACGGPF
ncbi:MAG TPA: DUF2599 domain-containing protein [Mycobacterium sp.]|jgi:hypothetical protein|nr:DUF2599 domain-containing protein [Mycobacterium sp.]